MGSARVVRSPAGRSPERGLRNRSVRPPAPERGFVLLRTSAPRTYCNKIRGRQRPRDEAFKQRRLERAVRARPEARARRGKRVGGLYKWGFPPQAAASTTKGAKNADRAALHQ